MNLKFRSLHKQTTQPLNSNIHHPASSVKGSIPTMRNFIPDGYTESGYIAERRGIYEACRFKYRRMLHGSRAKVAGSVTEAAVGAKAVYAALEHAITEWDIVRWTPGDATGEKDEPLPVKALNIAKLAPELIERLFNIIAGYSASDDDPQAAPKVERDEIDALLDGQNLNDQAAEADEKN